MVLGTKRLPLESTFIGNVNHLYLQTSANHRFCDFVGNDAIVFQTKRDTISKHCCKSMENDISFSSKEFIEVSIHFI